MGCLAMTRSYTPSTPSMSCTVRRGVRARTKRGAVLRGAVSCLFLRWRRLYSKLSCSTSNVSIGSATTPSLPPSTAGSALSATPTRGSSRPARKFVLALSGSLNLDRRKHALIPQSAGRDEISMFCRALNSSKITIASTACHQGLSQYRQTNRPLPFRAQQNKTPRSATHSRRYRRTELCCPTAAVTRFYARARRVHRYPASPPRHACAPQPFALSSLPFRPTWMCRCGLRRVYLITSPFITLNTVLCMSVILYRTLVNQQHDQGSLPFRMVRRN